MREYSDVGIRSIKLLDVPYYFALVSAENVKASIVNVKIESTNTIKNYCFRSITTQEM